MSVKVYNLTDQNAPDDCVYIGRGSVYGNPYIIGVHGNRTEVINKYIEYIEANVVFKNRIISELKGKNLACFCKPKACHGDYLIKLCNLFDDIEF